MAKTWYNLAMLRFFKILLNAIAVIILVSGSFGVGILVAQLKLGAQKNAQKTPVSSQERTAQEETPVAEENVVVPENITPQVQESVVPETVQKEETKFSFALVGDTQRFDQSNPSGSLARASQNIRKQNVNFVLALGDLVSSCDTTSECEGKLAKWKTFFKETIYPVQGNHDRTGKGKADTAWEKVFDLPKNGPSGFVEFAYSFDFDNSHFVALDSDKPDEFKINGTQRAWLEADLAKNKKKNVFVFFHEPAYPTNSKIGEGLDTNPADRNALWAILKKHKVTAVFSGHEHINSRRKVDGIYQFVFGNTDSFDHLSPNPGMAEYSFVGTNYGIVEVVDEQVTVKVFSTNGVLLNSFVIPTAAS